MGCSQPSGPRELERAYAAGASLQFLAAAARKSEERVRALLEAQGVEVTQDSRYSPRGRDSRFHYGEGERQELAVLLRGWYESGACVTDLTRATGIESGEIERLLVIAGTSFRTR
ncbi:hypothetical protein [Streptomyces specialis]|uniref:hypothetical protein n=1 Tax=Streptomyces specialis TaxID=498367 RepID=UPI00073E378F|nr:hypothetical protein [Streptomyces specialis]